MNSDNTSDIIATGTSAFAQTYAQLPIVIASGAGCTVTDTDGKTYLDFVAGIAVNALGYGDTDLAKALHAVIDAGITHCSNLYWNTPAVTAAASLVRLSGLKKVFFCNSGLKRTRQPSSLHENTDISTRAPTPTWSYPCRTPFTEGPTARSRLPVSRSITRALPR